MTTTAILAAQLNVGAALAEGEAALAALTADALFTESARAFADALESGVSASELARSVKQIATERSVPKGLAGSLYTVAASVMYHARTGAILSLGGDLPEGETARNVQTLVRGLPTKVVDAIIDDADDIETAVLALYAATRKADAVEGDETDEQGEGKAPRKPEKGFADFIKAAAPLLAKARETADGNVSDETRALLAAITDHVAFIQSVVTHNDIVEDAVAVL